MDNTYVFLADGFEEIEALTAVDVLRRAGLDVKTVSITASNQVKGAHGVEVNTDMLFADTSFADARLLVLPGGMPGASNLYAYEPLRKLIEIHNDAKKPIAAICAAPAVVLGQMGLLKGHKATCYPGFEEMCDGAEMVDSRAVVSGNIITGNGPASALTWALTVARQMVGDKTADEVAAGMLV